ncbi:MAG: DUF1697 domain-containing protein [Aureliella sp.]
MASIKYLALLRGINVGGKNIIKMADLKACLEELRLDAVSTYIQSGNVIFQSDEPDKLELERTIESTLSKAFNSSSAVVVLSHRELRQVVKRAPEGFGEEPDQYRYDVAFLKEPLTAKEILNQLSLKEGVDQAHAGKRALYFSRLTSRATESRLSRLASLPIYPQMTARNWNTTSKLLALLDEE